MLPFGGPRAVARTDCVVHPDVLAARSVFEIDEPVVRGLVVEVKNLVPFRARPYKSLKYQLMHLPRVALADGDGQVP
jgi:hypothetical protein